MNIELPAFLDRRQPNKGNEMTPAPAAEPKTKKRRTDAYVCRMTISTPLDMANAESLAQAIKAADAIQAALPAGSKVEFASRGFGKMPA